MLTYSSATSDRAGVLFGLCAGAELSPLVLHSAIKARLPLQSLSILILRLGSTRGLVIVSEFIVRVVTSPVVAVIVVRLGL